MKLQYINNACTLIQGQGYKLLFDPWIYGHLYNGKWHPEKLAKNYDKKNLKNLTHLFISHLHQDHWDLDTLKVINKNVLVLIPDFPFNRIIETTLRKYEFNSFKYIKTETFFGITDNVFVKVIPQLNDFGNELSKYDLQSTNPYVSFDTSLLIRDTKNNNCHLLLGDNTPYNKDQLTKSLEGLQIQSLWFPFNGFADDYPLCYDNFSIKEKQSISKKMCLAREASLLKAIEAIDPMHVVPHSSDFLLSGKRANEFKLVHDKKFRSRYLYSKRLKKNFNIPAIYLGVGDEISFSSNKAIKLSKKLNIQPKQAFKDSKMCPRKEINPDFNILVDLQKALDQMKVRCEKYNIELCDFKDWNLEIDLTDLPEKYVVSFSDDTVTFMSNKNKNKKILSLKIARPLLFQVLNREIHLNNSIIGNELSWNRDPNVYNQNLYNALNFLHK